MNKTRQKLVKRTGCARLITSAVSMLGRINIVFAGEPEGKNNFEYVKYKNLLKGSVM